MKRFQDTVTIITGASSGLGPVMARMMADEGARLVLAARRVALVEEVARDIGEAAVAIQADVTQEDDVAAMVELAMTTWGKVDVLMNNAAIAGTDKLIWEQTLDNWNATIAVDLTGAMLCTREVLNRSMLERKRGAIVNFSSAAGWDGLPRKSHYSSAKGALRIFTKVVAKEAGEYGIRCNCVVPGSIDTELLRNYHKRLSSEQNIPVEDIRKQSAARTALKTISTPEDVARLAMFLASDEARTITGQSMNVDAGYTMT